jgi:DNA-binding XRE family transcriptional regulator
MKTATRKQEIVRLCVLLTALDYEVTLEDSYHTKMGNRLWEEIDSSFEEEEVRSMTYEKLYFFFTNKEYTPYAESDDLDNWLKANLCNLYEAQNPQIFKKYDGISLAVHINKYKCIYWTSQQYQLIRLGRRIKFLRVQKGLRQNELGIHTSMVSQIENGLFNPTTSTLNKIALALNTTLTLK